MKLLFSLLFFLFISKWSWTTSYLPIQDSDLVDGARFIMIGQVVDQQTGLNSHAETRYVVEVTRQLKGSSLPNQITMVVPGGFTREGVGLKVFGAPQFQTQEEGLFFLQKDSQGRFVIDQLMLGAFRRTHMAGKTYSWRNLSDTVSREPNHADASDQANVRDWFAFSQWIEDRVQGHERRPDYWSPKPENWQTLARQKYNFTQTEGVPLRWKRFDSGETVPWFAHASGQPGMVDHGYQEFQNAIASWNRIARIDYKYVGTNTSTGGLSTLDSENTLLFDDPNGLIPGSYQCGRGGILAVAGGWFNVGQTEIINGEPFAIIFAADIVTQDGAGCIFGRNSGADGEEVFAHELGHTLGLDHSCRDSEACVTGSTDDQAIMRYKLHGDGRGAALGWDDHAAVTDHYGSIKTADFEIASRLVYPWTSHSPVFGSNLIVNNTHATPAKLFITGRRSDGVPHYATRELGSNCFLTESIDSIFPELERGAGLTIVVESSLSGIYGSWVSYNRNTPTGRSPAKSVAIRAPGSGIQPEGRSGKKILFSYLPNTEGFISVPVLVNIGDQPADVTLAFVNSNGQTVGPEMVLQDLPPHWPHPVTLGSMIPTDKDVQLIATSSQMITGIDFVFNQMGEPAMGNVTALLPNPNSE